MKGHDGRITVRGASLGYERRGVGPDLIWGHGLTSSRAIEDRRPVLDWDAVPATVHRYDARGHGESDSTPDLDGYTWAALARDQLALADAVGVDRYVAAGASMGCGTALHAAVTAPERIRALVLVIPPTAWETRAAQAEQWEAAAQVVAARGVEPMIAAGADIDPPDPYVGDEDRRLARAEALRSWDRDRLALAFRGAAGADLPDRSAVAAIALPALVLAWTGDPTHPASTATELASLLPDARLHLASTASELGRWSGYVADFVSEVAGDAPASH